MKPSQAAARLRSVALRIDSSERPSRFKVARSIRRLIATLESTSQLTPKVDLVKLLQERMFSMNTRPPKNEAPVGTGPELFPGVDALDESNWWLQRTDDGSIALMGSQKGDVDVVYEPEKLGPGMWSPDFGAMAQALTEDAQATIEMIGERHGQE